VNLPDPVENVVRNRRLRRMAIAVVAGGGLALGVSGLALAADTTPAPTPSSSSAAPERRTRQPHLDGTVKSIAGGHILIVDRDGFTRQINFTGTPDGVAVGVRIHAEGTVNADGVSLDAKTVGVAPARPAGKDGPGGPRGPHAPRGEGAKPPAGVPSAPPVPSDSAAPAAPPAPSATS
jgi:hypothetical protein